MHVRGNFKVRLIVLVRHHVERTQTELLRVDRRRQIVPERWQCEERCHRVRRQKIGHQELESEADVAGKLPKPIV